jgi:L-threonylcarbamoyladenylate synthase
MGRIKVLKATANNILAASETIKRGGLVIYPTDTVYGLGCDPLNVEATRRVFKTKGERKKPLPILASDGRQAEKIACLTEKARKITARFWPGPLTIVVPKKPILPDIVTSNLDSVGVRVPDHEIAVKLITLSGGFLTGTSANKTGEKPPRTVLEVAGELGEEVDLILDGGRTPIGSSSTVIDLTSGTPRLLRKGPVGLEEVLRIIDA